jgi:hypothetical protein
VRRADNFTAFMCRLSGNSRSLNLLEPQEPVAGKLYLLPCWIWSYIITLSFDFKFLRLCIIVVFRDVMPCNVADFCRNLKGICRLKFSKFFFLRNFDNHISLFRMVSAITVHNFQDRMLFISWINKREQKKLLFDNVNVAHIYNIICKVSVSNNCELQHWKF